MHRAEDAHQECEWKPGTGAAPASGGSDAGHHIGLDRNWPSHGSRYGAKLYLDQVLAKKQILKA